MKYNQRILYIITKILNRSMSEIRKILKLNNINIIQLYDILIDQHAYLRRDEFYSMFKKEHETLADIMWESFMDDYFLLKHNILLPAERKMSKC